MPYVLALQQGRDPRAVVVAELVRRDEPDQVVRYDGRGPVPAAQRVEEGRRVPPSHRVAGYAPETR